MAEESDLVKTLLQWANVLDIPSGQFVNENIREAAARILSLEAELKTAREALDGMLYEWDKFTRYGSPIAKASNENVTRARAAALAYKK